MNEPNEIIEEPRPAQNDAVRRLMWAGLLAGTGALASIAATRVSALIWTRVFDEEPPKK